MPDAFDNATLAKLRSGDTPTVCNALEVLNGRRSATGFTKVTVLAAEPALPSMVGFARTACIRAASPAEMTPEEVRKRRLAY